MKNWIDNGYKYSRNILGIISLMLIVIACIFILAIINPNHLSESNQTVLIAFCILFLFCILFGFLWTITKHPELTLDARNFPKKEFYIKALTIFLSGNLKKEKGSPIKAEKDIREDINNNINQIIEDIQKHHKLEQYILWVDDNPDKNTYERIALEQYGFHFILATSTNKALSLIYEKKYVAIISDMKRKEGEDEGYVLFYRLKKMNISIPFFIYTGYCTPKKQEEANRIGIDGFTNDSRILIDRIIKKI